MNLTSAAMAALFVVAFVFGVLTWVSRHVWQSPARTRACAIVAIISTLIFTAMAWSVL